MWQLILCVFGCSAQTKYYFWVCQWRVFLNEINIWINELSRLPSQCEWAASNPWRAWIEQKAEEFAPFSLPHAWSRTSLSPSFGLGFTPSASLVLRPLDSDWITAWALLGLQFADGRLWDFSASIYNHINQFPQINVSIANFWHCCYSGEHWLIQMYYK